MYTEDNHLRTVKFTPYRKGMGPVFSLTTWDAGETDAYRKNVLGYCLAIKNPDDSAWKSLFEGEDFCCSPMHAIDSDESITAIMKFLTLRPGDTDPEYFKNYTPEQLDYCSQHAEALASAVEARFDTR